MRSIVLFFLLFLGIAGGAMAQVKGNKLPKTDTNQVDSKGKRIGLWVTIVPARMGEEAYMEYGHYDHGNKYGKWYKLDDESNLKSIEIYKNNVLNGECWYFEKGRLTTTGYYRGINERNAFDTIVVIDPADGYEHIKAIPVENGTQRHGTWKYYDAPSGKLVRVEEYQVDNLIYHQDYTTTVFDSVAYLEYIKKLPHNRHTKTHEKKSFNHTIN